MINRIVKMKFKPEEVNNFITLFKATQPLIAKFDGCQSVSLLRDTADDTIFFTYSIWETPEALENYRQSDLFNTTWAKTKTLFADKPQAWSVKIVQ